VQTPLRRGRETLAAGIPGSLQASATLAVLHPKRHAQARRAPLRPLAVQTRRAIGIVLVIAGIAFVGLSVVSVYAIPAALLTLVLGALLIVRLGRGDAIFPALQEHMEYRQSVKNLESQPGPVCWRCGRQNRRLATECEGCGATLTQ
jgi:hypothetical protein